MFFAALDGFDTHGNQLVAAPHHRQPRQPAEELGDALGAFYAAMKALQLDDAVTAFTQATSAAPSPQQQHRHDHAWATPICGGRRRHAGRATARSPSWRWAASTTWGRQLGAARPLAAHHSVDQYAATLLGWFGASDAQLNSVLPNLANFGANRRLGSCDVTGSADAGRRYLQPSGPLFGPSPAAGGGSIAPLTVGSWFHPPPHQRQFFRVFASLRRASRLCALARQHQLEALLPAVGWR